MKQPFASESRSAPLALDLALTLLGPSNAMAQLWAQIRRLAPHIRTVLLTGESHCGQAAAAHLLLDLSAAPRRPFVELSAADAEQRLLGTSSFLPLDAFLFLPDLDRYSLPAQEALLRLMRLRRSRPFTIVAAVQEDLRSLVSTGRLLAELGDMLGAVQLALPALRQRTEDLPMIVSHMLSKDDGSKRQRVPPITEEFLRAIMAHPWPGNLAELTSVLQSVMEQAPGQELTGEHLAQALRLRQPSLVGPPAPIRMVPLETVVQEHISAVLRACRGNKLRASEVLGISRSTLYRMLDTATAAPGSLPLAGVVR